jgi:hypothetical protein
MREQIQGGDQISSRIEDDNEKNMHAGPYSWGSDIRENETQLAAVYRQPSISTGP